MTTKENFLRMMRNHTEMALATSTYNQPNIRMVHFCFEETEKIIYFFSFENNDKIREFEINPKVAFATIPPQRNGRESIKAKGFVRKSRKTVYDIADQFSEKISDFKDIIKEMGEHLVLFELTFDAVNVMTDFENISVLEMN